MIRFVTSNCLYFQSKIVCLHCIGNRIYGNLRVFFFILRILCASVGLCAFNVDSFYRRFVPVVGAKCWFAQFFVVFIVVVASVFNVWLINHLGSWFSELNEAESENGIRFFIIIIHWICLHFILKLLDISNGFFWIVWCVEVMMKSALF